MSKNSCLILYFLIILSYPNRLLSQNISTYAGGGDYPGLNALYTKYQDTLAMNLNPDYAALDNAGRLYIMFSGRYSAGFLRVDPKIARIDTIKISGQLVAVGSDLSGNVYYLTSTSLVNAATNNHLLEGNFSMILSLTIDLYNNFYTHQIDGNSDFIGVSNITNKTSHDVISRDEQIGSLFVGRLGGFTVDRDANVYVSDQSNHVIWKIDSAGHKDLYAGNGIAGYSGDNALCINASLNRPACLAIDPLGNLLIGDYGNSRIRRVDRTTKIISTIAGNGRPAYFGTFGGDGGPALQGSVRPFANLLPSNDGSIFWAENGRVRKINNNGFLELVFGRYPVFYGEQIESVKSVMGEPRGLELNQGNLYISDRRNYSIRSIQISNGLIKSVAGNGEVAYSGDGYSALEAGIGPNSAVIHDKVGNLYFSNDNIYLGLTNLRQIDQNGIIKSLTGNLTNTTVYLCLDKDGNLVASLPSLHKIVSINLDTRISTIIAGTGIRGLNGDGDATSVMINSPTYVRMAPNGDLYFSDTGNNLIRKIRVADGSFRIQTVVGNGTISPVDGSAPRSTGMNHPLGLTFDQNGNLLYADSRNHIVRLVDLKSNIVHTIAGNGKAGFSGDGGKSLSAMLNIPTDIAVDNAGIIYLADSKNSRIRILTKSKQNLTFPPLPDVSLDNFFYLTLDASSDSGLPITYLYASDKIQVKDNIAYLLSPGKITITATQPGNQFFEPSNTISYTFCVKPLRPTIKLEAGGQLYLSSNYEVGNQWYENGNILAGETSSKLLVTHPGQYAVQNTVDGCTSSLSEDFNVVITRTVTEKINSIPQIYPNPAQRFITLSVGNQVLTNLVVTDLVGRKLNINFLYEDQKVTIDMTGAQNGLYLLQVQFESGESSTYKFIKN